MVSVIVPVYNAENRIRMCIDSVIAQTYNSFELILIDDGSIDMSGIICDEYACKDSRIKVIHKKNEGVGSARNVGLKLAKGEYITFLDSDDTWDKCFLEYATKKIGLNDLYLCGLKTYGNGSEKEYVPMHNVEVTPREMYENVFFTIPQMCVCGPCCKLFKRSIIYSNNITFKEELRCGEDTDFNLTYMQYAKNVLVDNKSLYNYYRGDSNSLFSTYNPQYYFDSVQVYDKWLKLIIDLNCSLETINFFQQKYIGMLIWNINTAFIHKRGKKEIKDIIVRLSDDKMIKKKIRLKGKNKIIRFLLVHRCLNVVYFLYFLYFVIT